MPAAAIPRPRSEAQRLASRLNGARSRGPVTAEGKARAARNALRHGLCSADTVLVPGEDPNEFAELLADLRAEHRPRDVSEDLLVQRLAVTVWKLARCDRLEVGLAVCPARPPAGRIYLDGTPVLLTRSAEFATLSAHAARLERTLHRILKALADRPARTARQADLPHDAPVPTAMGNRANEPEPTGALEPGARRPAFPPETANRTNEPEPMPTSLSAGSHAPDPTPSGPAAPPSGPGRPAGAPTPSARPGASDETPTAPDGTAPSTEARLLAGARADRTLALSIAEELAGDGDLGRLRRLLDALGTDLATFLAGPAARPAA